MNGTHTLASTPADLRAALDAGAQLRVGQLDIPVSSIAATRREPPQIYLNGGQLIELDADTRTTLDLYLDTIDTVSAEGTDDTSQPTTGNEGTAADPVGEFAFVSLNIVSLGTTIDPQTVAVYFDNVPVPNSAVRPEPGTFQIDAASGLTLHREERFGYRQTFESHKWMRVELQFASTPPAENPEIQYTLVGRLGGMDGPLYTYQGQGVPATTGNNRARFLLLDSAALVN